MNKKAALGRMLPEAAYFDVFENNVWKKDLYISGKKIFMRDKNTMSLDELWKRLE